MDEQWTYGMRAAYQSDPYTEVEVFAPKVWANDPILYVACAADGVPTMHDKFGRVYGSEGQIYALVPLRRKPREFWIVLAGGSRFTCDTREHAEDMASPCKQAEIVRVVETPDK